MKALLVGLRDDEKIFEPDVGCDCNETYGFMYLTSENSARSDGNGRRDDIGVAIDCGGNECSLTCKPFDPHSAKRLQITGILATHSKSAEIGGLYLKDIDFSASRQLVDNQWQLIPTGSFIIPRTPATPHPNACSPRP